MKIRNLIPELYNAYRVYNKGTFVGTSGDVELPELEGINETNEGAGVLGEIESPATGHFGSMVTKIKFAVLHEDLFSLMDGKNGVELTLRADAQGTDKETYSTENYPVKIVVRGRVKNANLGSLKKGKKGEPEIEIETMYLKIDIDNVTKFELDKLNFKYVVNGVDQLAQVRRNM